MAQTSVTYVIGDMVANTLSDTRQEIVDNIHKNNVFLAKMNLKNRRKMFNGGADIRRTVEYAKNNSTRSFSGWDVVPIGTQETLTDTIWSGKNYAGNWAVSWEEERQNSGDEHKIRDMAEQKKTSLERSFSEDISEDILNPASFTAVGNGGKDITPLTMLVSKAALTVGGISETANSWWANQRVASVSKANTPTAGSVIKKEMRHAFNLAGRFKDGFPDFLLGTQMAYELYESILDDKVRYADPKGVATLGFASLMFKTAEFTWDQLVPGTASNNGSQVAYDSGSYAEEAIFFLNTKYLYLLVDSGADFVMTPAVSHQQAGQFGTSGAMLARSSTTAAWTSRPSPSPPDRPTSNKENQSNVLPASFHHRPGSGALASRQRRSQHGAHGAGSVRLRLHHCG